MADARSTAASAINDVYVSTRTPLDVEALLPSDRGVWALSPALARWLARVVIGLERRSVLEFGAGWSSLVLAHSLAAAGGGRLTSVEHQPEYSERPWQRVQQVQGVDASLVVTGLRRRLSAHGLLWAYRDVRQMIAPRAPYDLVLVDAPPSRYGRTSTLHDAYPYLAAGAVIVLDDAARIDEQTVTKRWLSFYPGLELAVMDTEADRGIAVLVHDGRKNRRLAARAVAGTFRDQWRNFRRE